LGPQTNKQTKNNKNKARKGLIFGLRSRKEVLPEGPKKGPKKVDAQKTLFGKM
jgi:hypothetical protein